MAGWVLNQSLIFWLQTVCCDVCLCDVRRNLSWINRIVDLWQHQWFKEFFFRVVFSPFPNFFFFYSFPLSFARFGRFLFRLRIFFSFFFSFLINVTLSTSNTFFHFVFDFFCSAAACVLFIITTMSSSSSSSSTVSARGGKRKWIPYQW